VIKTLFEIGNEPEILTYDSPSTIFIFANALSKSAQYLHPSPWVAFLDKLVFGVAMVSPLMTIPQLVQIWEAGNAAGVSLPTWMTYTCSSAIWLTYGITHRDPHIIVGNSLFVCINAAIVGSALYFG
jgi:uncharacterized protein with PQ loop repeat